MPRSGTACPYQGCYLQLKGKNDLNYHPSSDGSFCPISEGVPGGKTEFYA